jgi:mono/diheme cytochrome c family protein
MRATLIILLILVLAAAWGIHWLHSAHGFSARSRPGSLEAWAARTARHVSMQPYAENLKNPLSPTPLLIAEARDHFADHCAVCHANNGSGKTIINAGLYPPAPDLRSRGTQTMSDGEIFYIIKEGVRWTGMPGWGGEDEENWQLVLFIRHMPDLNDRELELMNEVNHLEEK